MKSADVWEHLKEYILTSGLLDDLWESYVKHEYNDNVDRYDFHSKEFYKDQAKKALNKTKPWTRLSRKKIGNRIVREIDVDAYGDKTDWSTRNIIPSGITFEVTEENDQVVSIKTLKSDTWQRDCDITKHYDPNCDFYRRDLELSRIWDNPNGTLVIEPRDDD